MWLVWHTRERGYRRECDRWCLHAPRDRPGSTVAVETGGNMKRSTERILTSHAGSLPRPENLIALNKKRGAGEAVDAGAFADALSRAVTDTVRHQKEAGIDIPDDGEFGKAMSAATDYGAWWNYA